MNNLEYSTHREILDNLLTKMNIPKTEFALRLGYSKTNYTSVLHKPMYTQKLINKICSELDIPTSVFDLRNNAPFQINQNNGTVSQNITSELYERFIASLENQLSEAKEEIKELKSKLKNCENKN